MERKKIFWLRAGGVLAALGAAVGCIGPCLAICAGGTAVLSWVSGSVAKWVFTGLALLAFAAIFGRRKTSAQLVLCGPVCDNKLGRIGSWIVRGAAIGTAVVVIASQAQKKFNETPSLNASDNCDPKTTQNMKSNHSEIKNMDVYCRLQPPELKERAQTVLADLSARLLEATPLNDGYSLKLKPGDDSVRLVAEVIVAERRCCPFLQFQLTVTQESQPLFLELRGPAASREILADLLRLPFPTTAISRPISMQ